MFKFGALATAVLAQSPDPRKDYFEKEGARFAQAFLFGAKIGAFDEIDLYQCLQREPEAVRFFY